MSVRSILNAFNRCFLICGMGSLNYNQGKCKTTMMFFILRCIITCCAFKLFYDANIKWAERIDPYLFDITSIILMCFYEIIYFEKILSNVWRIFFDNQLSVVLTKLEAIHEKLIHLNAIRTMQIKTNWLFTTGIMVHIIASNGVLIKWILFNIFTDIYPAIWTTLVLEWVSNINYCIAFYEYILLISYIQWMVRIINGQIPLRYSTISTYRDMYLEVIECLNDINKSIYGLPAILSFIAGNIAHVVFILYYCIIFPNKHYFMDELVSEIIVLLTRLVNIIILYGIGDSTEKEINRMSVVLNQRSTIERNPRIKRQIKFFTLRRLHENYHFKLFGICEINLRQLFVLSNKTIAYIVIQILFKLNRH